MVKEFFNKLCFAKKKIVDMFLKNGDFCPASTASSALTRTKMNKDPFPKKDSLAHYLSYATLMTYALVVGGEQL